MTRSLAELRQYLAGEWLFDNDFKDTSGNGNHGTPTDIEWKPTLRGMKPRFNGSTSLVNCNGIDLNNALTISVWFKSLDLGLAQGILAKKSSAEWTSNVGYSINLKSDGGILAKIGTAESHGMTDLDDNNWHNVIITWSDADTIDIFIDGQEITYDAQGSASNITSSSDDLKIGLYYSTTFLDGFEDNILIFSTKLTATEVINHYNETKGEYGVMPAEHSFTHNPDDVIDASDAVGAWGTAKESTTELVDLSGNGNIADINGAMPTEGFIQGRRFDGVDDYLDCGDDNSLRPSNYIAFTSIIQSKSLVGSHRFIDYLDGGGGYRAYSNGDEISVDIHNGTTVRNVLTTDLNITTDCVNIISCGLYDGDIVVFCNGIQSSGTTPLSGVLTHSSQTLTIGSDNDGGIVAPTDGIIFLSTLYGVECSLTLHTNIYNTFACLPFWSVNYTDYPDNVTEYTDKLPYSSSIINSGTFKVDDDKLQCVSAGTITYSASYEFDGSEYIKVEIGGVEYASTGTITQGNTTVSVAQGSNKITIEMGTGDTIDGDGIDIQFREEV